MMIMLIKYLYWICVLHWICVLNISSIRQIGKKNGNKFLGSTRENNLSHLIDKVIEYCFFKDKRSTVILSNWSKNNTNYNFLFRSSIPVNLFGPGQDNVLKNYKRFQKVFVLTEAQVRTKLYPATGVIIITSSVTILTSTLKVIKDSVWWNSRADYLIVDNNLSSDCKLANEFLKMLWKFNIVSALFVCKKLDNEHALYSFNPYANYATKLWKKEQMNYSDDSWNLYKLPLQGENYNYFFNQNKQSFCKNMYFDKTKNLHGYTLKLILVRNTVDYLYDKTKAKCDRFVGSDFNIMCELLTHLNINITTKLSSIYGSISQDGKPQGLLKDVMDGQIDCSMFTYFQRDYWYFQTYTFHSGVIKIISLKRRMSWYENFLYVFHFNYWLIMIISVVSIISLKYVLSESLSIAVLEFVRILASGFSFRRPTSSLKKLLLVFVILGAFVLNTYVQSRLNALHVVSKNVSKIDTVEDLNNSDVIVYGYPSHADIMKHIIISARYRKVNEMEECINLLLQGGNMVCICAGSLLHMFGDNSELIHKSKSNLLDRSIAYTCSEDFPLLQRFSIILLKMSEAGIIKQIFTRNKGYAPLYQNPSDTNSMDIEKLIAAFYILLIGWSMASFSFVGECIYVKCRALVIMRSNKRTKLKIKQYLKLRKCKSRKNILQLK